MRNALLLMVSLLCALLLSELLLRLVPLRLVGAPLSRYDPTYGHIHKKNFQTTHHTPDFTARMSTNSLGFRGSEPVDNGSNAVLFIGDSFTFGWGVSDGQEYPALVQTALRRPVINAAISNHGQGRWLKFLRSEANRFDFDVIVLQMSESDFFDNELQPLFSLGPRGDLHELPPPRLSTGRRMQMWLEHVPFLSNSHVFALMRQAFHDLRRRRAAGIENTSTIAAKHSSDPQPHYDLTIRLLDESLRICRKRGWPVVAIFADMDSSYVAAVQPVFARYGVPTAAMPTKRQRPDLYFKIDGHWNEAGHRYAADLVVQLLRRTSVIPARTARR